MDESEVIKPMEHAEKMAKEQFPDDPLFVFNMEGARSIYVKAIKDVYEDPTPFGLGLHSSYQTEKIEREFASKLLADEQKRLQSLIDALEKMRDFQTDELYKSHPNENILQMLNQMIADALNQYNKAD